MHKDWEELIPFYVAGSLPRPDTSRLESHLARCEDCRRSVDEWRAIASVVRADAAAQLRDLPPLSSRVTQTAARQVGSRRAQAQSSYAPLQRIAPRPTSTYRATSVTLIAAVFTVIIFGGLLALMVLRGSLLLPQPAAESVVLMPSATPFPQAASETPSPAPQIIVIEPSATPITPAPTLPTATPLVAQTTAAPLIFITPIPPTSTPPLVVATRLPPTSAPPPTASPETSIEAFSLQAPALKDACTLHSAVTLNLSTGPGSQYGIVSSASATDGLPALASSDNGWFQTQLADGTVGWVRADQVYTSGNCDSLPMIASVQPTIAPPTATVYSGVPVVVVSADSVNLRSGPGTIYPIVSLAFVGDRIPVTAQARASGGIWYLVDQAGQGAVWVSASVVQLLPADAFVPLAATIPPTPAPSETVIPFMSTSTPASSPTDIPTIQKPAQ